VRKVVEQLQHNGVVGNIGEERPFVRGCGHPITTGDPAKSMLQSVDVGIMMDLTYMKVLGGKMLRANTKTPTQRLRASVSTIPLRIGSRAYKSVDASRQFV
jgi:hypothetical protein